MTVNAYFVREVLKMASLAILTNIYFQSRIIHEQVINFSISPQSSNIFTLKSHYSFVNKRIAQAHSINYKV